MSESLPLSVWPIAQETSIRQRRDRYLKESLAHPGKMMPAIARHAINTYTKPGDTVVDPMCGIGTTLVEAAHLGRNAAGVELESRWVDLANKNIDFAQSQGATGRAIAHCGDGRDVASLVDPTLVNNVALVITSPPYGPSLHGQVRPGDDGVEKYDNVYSKSRNNLGYASEAGLLQAFGDILAGCRELLRPGGVIVITTRPWRRNGELVDLPSAVLRLGGDVGLTPIERNVALLCALRDDRLIGRPSFFQLDHVRKARAKGNPLSVIAHEDVIVLRKESK